MENVAKAGRVRPIVEGLPFWATATVIEFQQLSLRPLSEKLKKGEKFGPSWQELIENDFCIPNSDYHPKSDREKFVRRGLDIINSLMTLETCHEMLTNELKKRIGFPSHDRIEVVLIAIDATIYTLQQRMEKFCKLPPINGKIENSILREPPLVEERRKRRGMHTHQFNQKLIDSSSIFVLMTALTFEKNESKIDEMRNIIQSEVRRVFRIKINAEIEKLEQIQKEISAWVDGVFSNSKMLWKKYLKEM